MAHRIAWVLAAGAVAAARPPDLSACFEQSCPTPVLLQMQRSIERAVTDSDAEIALPPLPPAFVAPPDAEKEAAMREVPMRAQVDAGMPAQHAERDWESYLALKELRAQGFRCPGGSYFPPNSTDELLLDCRLWRAAYLHSRDMGERGYFSHTTPEGKDPFDRSSAQGFGTFNENVAAGVSDAVGTLKQWKESDGHCKNMMNPSHNRIGVGYAYVASSAYQHYWTQLLGASRDAADTSCYISGGSAGRGSTSAQPTTTPGSSAGGTCTDESTNCASWASSGYCSSSSQYYGYMKVRCARSCDACMSPAPATGSGSSCEDTTTSCASWVSAGYCSSSSEYYNYMKTKCSKACGFCR